MIALQSYFLPYPSPLSIHATKPFSFKIEVKQKNKGDDFSIGTGFLFRYRKTDGTVISTVINNRHVIEDAISFRILTKDDKELPHSDIHIDTVRDIAQIELNDDETFIASIFILKPGQTHLNFGR